jgi:non-ribosomal peptide synthetase component E (peptide arylation enzyme)
MEGSMQCNANYVPLTPISFLERSAIVYGDKLSMVFNNVTYTWSQTHQRCIKLASSISQLGVSQNDVVCFYF